MSTESIEERNGGYYVAGTRISLDSVVYAFNEGQSPEQIVENFPLLGNLAKAYGAIAYYLDHKAVVDQHLAQDAQAVMANSLPLSEENPELWERIQKARIELGRSRP